MMTEKFLKRQTLRKKNLRKMQICTIRLKICNKPNCHSNHTYQSDVSLQAKEDKFCYLSTQLNAKGPYLSKVQWVSFFPWGTYQGCFSMLCSIPFHCPSLLESGKKKTKTKQPALCGYSKDCSHEQPHSRSALLLVWQPTKSHSTLRAALNMG